MGLRGRTRLLDYHLFFVTTTCHEFVPFIDPVEVKNILIANLKFYCTKHSAHIVAYALMPEHIHLMIYFSEENRLIEFMRDFKKFTSKQIREYWSRQSAVPSRIANSLSKCNNIWMNRFDDLYLYSPKVCYTKLNYINRNPVARGLCLRANEYDYSSAGFYEGRKHDKIPLTHLGELL